MNRYSALWIAMYIETIPNHNSPSAIVLRESYHVDGKVKKRTLLKRQ
jgi:hypothetical protein